MIRDYAHHQSSFQPRQRQQRARAATRFRAPFPLLASAAVMVCALFLFGFQFKTREAEPPTPSLSPALESAVPSTEVHPAPRPRFDFYDLLTEKASERYQHTATAPLHVVELGTFKDQQTLEAIEVRLKMSGFDPQTMRSPASPRGVRLFLGPFASELAAQKVKRSLKEAGFTGSLVVEYSSN